MWSCVETWQGLGGEATHLDVAQPQVGLARALEHLLEVNRSKGGARRGNEHCDDAERDAAGVRVGDFEQAAPVEHLLPQGAPVGVPLVMPIRLSWGSCCRGGRRGSGGRRWLGIQDTLHEDDAHGEDRDGAPLVRRELLAQQEHRAGGREENFGLVRHHADGGFKVGVADVEHDVLDSVQECGNRKLHPLVGTLIQVVHHVL